MDFLYLATLFIAVMAIPVSLHVVGAHQAQVFERALEQAESAYNRALQHALDTERTGEPIQLATERLSLEKEKLSILRMQNEARRPRTKSVEDVTS